MKPLAERLGRDPNGEERFEDIEARLEALEAQAKDDQPHPKHTEKKK
jgi:hypothetical protein